MEEEEQRAFKDSKEKLLSTPMLKFLDFIKSFEVHINANDFIISGVFM
jgi:hypothetical protein